MGRRSTGRNQGQTSDHFDDLLNETPVSRHTPSPAHFVRPPRTTVGVSDLRRWDPAPLVARDAAGRPARIVHAPQRQGRQAAAAKPLRPRQFTGVAGYPRASFRFETGATIPICAKRRTRREVLHALHKTKSGKGSPKKRNQWSSISCGKR